MFSLLEEFGDHAIYKYDITKHDFISYFNALYSTNELSKITLNDNTYNKENIHDIETNLHKQFYSSIKNDNTFKKLYCLFIKDIYSYFFPDETFMIYQSFPSIRLQFKNNITVPPHYDSDTKGNHPVGEKNFLLPITKMYGTNRLFIESAPGTGNFKGIDLEYGNLFYFNGNKCLHYNEKNIENHIRISLDFRIILKKDYIKYINSDKIVHTNPRDPEKNRTPTKMIIGGYYQLTKKEDSLEEMMGWLHQKDMLLQSQPNFDIQEANACFEYMKSGNNFVTEYKQTEELEKMICKYINVKHCIMTTSGNMALILSLMALDIKEGDEVIVPNYTMIASINSIKMIGAIPIIIDVQKDTFTISLDEIQKYITHKTKAIMHVSLNNREYNIEEIKNYCKINNLYLIEDSAQSLGCFVKGKHFGTFGDIGCFSLSPPKIISTGQGGFVVTDNTDLYNKMMMIKNFGRKSGGIDIFEVFGINMKFTDIQAVIGIEQMKKLPGRIIRMREIFDIYYKNLHNYCRLIYPAFDTWIPWFIDIFIDNRESLMIFLKKHNIQTRITYPEINKTPMYFNNKLYPNSEYVSKMGLFLPSHTHLTNDEIKNICNLIILFID
jgi:perosamine synthetase